MNRSKLVVTLFAIAVLGLAGAPSVQAASIRVFDVGSATGIIINDNDANDAVPVTGIVAHSGTIGDFIVDFELGITKPVVGSPTAPLMVLTIGAVSGPTTGGQLVIDFTETDFGPTGSLGGIAFAGGLGVSTGTVAYNTFYDPANGLFGGTPLTAEAGGPGPIIFAQNGVLATTAFPYSLTQRLTITQGPGGNTLLGDASPVILAVTPIPDGGLAVGLLGFALIGVEGLRRKYTRL